MLLPADEQREVALEKLRTRKEQHKGGTKVVNEHTMEDDLIEAEKDNVEEDMQTPKRSEQGERSVPKRSREESRNNREAARKKMLATKEKHLETIPEMNEKEAHDAAVQQDAPSEVRRTTSRKRMNRDTVQEESSQGYAARQTRARSKNIVDLTDDESELATPASTCCLQNWTEQHNKLTEAMGKRVDVCGTRVHYEAACMHFLHRNVSSCCFSYKID